jgi:hypothetical protein
MKLVKQANGKTTIKMSKRQWLDMGKKAGWLDKEAWMGGDGKTPLGGEREYVVPTIENQEMLPHPGNNMNRGILIDVYLREMGSDLDTWDQNHEALTKMNNQDIHDALVELGYRPFEVIPKEDDYGSRQVWP